MNALKFKYKIPSQLRPLIMGTMIGYTDEYLYGFVEAGVLSQLNHHGLYIVCECKQIPSKMIYQNPVVVVAKNESDALRIYYEELPEAPKDKIIRVHSRIMDNCKGLKVEAV